MKTSQKKEKKYEKQKNQEKHGKTSHEKKQGEKNTFEKQNSSFQRDGCKLIALSRTEPIRSEPYRNECNATDDNSDKPTTTTIDFPEHIIKCCDISASLHFIASYKNRLKLVYFKIE